MADSAVIEGRAWTYGDNIDTDLIAPVYSMRGTLQEGAPHCLENLDPDFAPNVREGDVFVAGQNLGIGSSREFAPHYLKHLGIRAILARSFARIFYRNALNLGVPPLVCAETDRIGRHDILRIDPVAGTVENLTRGEDCPCDPIPAHLMEMVADGGLMAHLEKKLKKAG